MNKTEAVAVNTVLRWMLGDGAISAATAYRQAEILAGRVTTTLGAGVRPGQVREAFTRLHGRDDTAPPAPDAPVLMPTPEGGHATIEADAVRALVGHVAERDTTDLAVSLHPVHTAPVRDGAEGGARDA